jgi:hypothetical protein
MLSRRNLSRRVYGVFKQISTILLAIEALVLTIPSFMGFALVVLVIRDLPQRPLDRSPIEIVLTMLACGALLIVGWNSSPQNCSCLVDCGSSWRWSRDSKIASGLCSGCCFAAFYIC